MSSGRSFTIMGMLQAKTGRALSQEQLESLLQRPAAGMGACWMAFIFTLIRTRDLYEAAIALLECLMATGKVAVSDVPMVHGVQQAIRSVAGQDEFFLCVFNLVLALFAGGSILKAFYDFLLCLIGSPEPPVPPPSGDVPEFNPNPVSRCG